MNSPPLLSVIIPSYKSTRTLVNCVKSVIQTQDPNLEIIIIDDRSPDHSYSLACDLKSKFPRVHCYQLEKNGGPARARNYGARIAKGEYLFFLDSDTEMLPQALKHFRKSILNAEAVTGIYDYRPLNRGAVPQYKALLNYYFFSRKGIIDYEVFDASRAGIRKEVFETMGGFNESLTWGMDYENEEFGYRLVKKYRNILNPNIAVKHVFPTFKNLSHTYFSRVALWAEIFFHRKQFESGGVTSKETGMASACLLAGLFLIPWSFQFPSLTPINLLFLVGYLLGYRGFFAFVWVTKPHFLAHVVFLNIYFTSVIAVGAAYGFLKALTGRASPISSPIGES